MSQTNATDIFTEEILKELLPPQRSDEFFDALYGDAAEGAYDISLSFIAYDPRQQALTFELLLHERPQKCLACNLTYGLPEVFSRHPLINIQGMVEKIEALLAGNLKCTGWELGRTRTKAANIHAIPLMIWLG